MEFKLVWFDEFDYEGKPDPAIWDYEVGNHGFGNNELQAYTDHEANAFVKDGVLHICGQKEKDQDDLYTSAKLTTYGKKSFLYGKLEFSAKLPKGKGTWPAVWMLSNAMRQGVHWPECGEIDILEHIGRSEDQLHFSLHSKTYNHRLRNQYTSVHQIDGVTEGFHDYSMVWLEDSVEFFIDGQSMAKFEKGMEGRESDEDAWPFNQPYYLMINLALGGFWGGELDENCLPAELELKYIRFYEVVD